MEWRKESMKAHMQQEKELILLYGIEEDRFQKLQKMFETLQIETIPITKDMLVQTVGYCAGMQGFEKISTSYDGELPPYEMMLMSGIVQKRLQEILNIMRQSGLVIERKAVITPTNRDWPFLKLYQEICKEHEFMKERRVQKK